MAEAGVDRLVTLMGADVREDGESVSLSGRVMGAALKLVAREMELRRGDLDDRASLVAAFEGVFYPSLAPEETARGERMVAAAREAGCRS